VIKKPIYRLTDTQREFLASRAKKFDAFFAKYATPILAWIERQDRKEIRWLYEALKEPGLTADQVFCLFVGRSIKVPTIRKLNDYWFRAAYRELVKGGRDDYLKIDDLAFAFDIKPTSRAYDLVIKEDEFRPRPPLTLKLRKEYQSFWKKRIEGLPGAPGIRERLNFALNKRLRTSI